MTSPPTDPTRVDELRERLRALGYLDARVDRFVLAPASGTRSVAAIAWRSSLRIGTLAGLLLGPAAAVGITLRLPGLVTGPGDAVVIALYLALLFGIVTAAAAFVAAEIVRRLIARDTPRYRPRRTRRLAAAAGLTVGVSCLVYLTLWWRTASAGVAWTAPGRTTFALGVAVAMSLLLGHAVRVTALALAARAADAASLQPKTRRSFWRFSGPLGLASFAGAAVLLLSTTPAVPSAPAPGFAVVPTGLRVVLLAVDGFDSQLFAQLQAEGEVPALSRLTGGALARLAPQDATDPARAWTTLATGQPPEVHGVSGLETRRVAGIQGAVPASRSPLVGALAAATDLIRLTRPSLTTDDQRRQKTLWEVAAEKGLRTATVNWWTTWPASADAGIVISDRAPVRLERGGALDAEIAPAELYPGLQEAWPALTRDARMRAGSAFEAVTDGHARATLERSAELDALLVRMALHLEPAALDLLLLYLPGLDIAQHALLAQSAASALPPSALTGRLDALRAYYRYLDGLTAEVMLEMDRRAAGSLLALVTQPGRVDEPGSGLLALQGPHVRRAAPLSATVMDVMPTLLYALGLPVSAELAGRPLTGLFEEAFVRRYPVRDVASYGPRQPRAVPRTGQALDAEAIERLRSLGYVR